MYIFYINHKKQIIESIEIEFTYNTILLLNIEFGVNGWFSCIVEAEKRLDELYPIEFRA